MPLTYPERLPSIQVASGSQSARTVASIEQAKRSSTARFYEGGCYDIRQPSAARSAVGGVGGGMSSYEASNMLPPNPWRWPGVRVDMDALSDIWLTPRHGMTSHSRYKGLNALSSGAQGPGRGGPVSGDLRGKCSSIDRRGVSRAERVGVSEAKNKYI